MNWIQYVNQLETTSEDTGFGFNAPLAENTLADIKKAFHLNELPAQLESLLLQTDGIHQKMGDVVIGYLIWPAERILETNLQFRNYPDFKDLYMSFDQLFFFSDAGNGDQFAFATLNGNFPRNDVFVWNHEDDSRTWVAPDLEKFLAWWLNGQITV
jgi:hypothetical protein